MQTELPFKTKLHYFFPVLFCFCLPFGTLLLSAIIVGWTITSFFSISRIDLKKGLSNRFLWLSYSFFLLTVFSALVSENKEEALFSIEVKMSFLIFPYLLFCFKWPHAILKRCVISFVSGCFFASLILILRAFTYAFNGQPEYWFYTYFSAFIHASYFSMYLLLAIFFVTILYHHWFKAQKSVIYSSYFFVSIFITTIFLCSSKLGFFSFIVCVPLVFLYRGRQSFNLKKTAYFLIASLVIVIVAMCTLPGPFSRLNSLKEISLKNIDKTSAESTTVRLLIWNESIDLIKNNLMFGTGVADANDELYQTYQQKGLTGAYSHKLNAHNQFFQTFIGMGIPGISLLLALTFGQLLIAMKKRKIFLFLFSLLIIMNFAVESMLQSSAGVLFFVFFACFFTLLDERELSQRTTMNLSN